MRAGKPLILRQKRQIELFVNGGSGGRRGDEKARFAERSCRTRYDGAIMMARTQITLDPELQRRARRKAGDLGVSFAEYVRRLVMRDLGGSAGPADPSAVFDLGDSGGSDIARNKDEMIGAAFAADR
jgi:hypothetical protein